MRAVQAQAVTFGRQLQAGQRLYKTAQVRAKGHAGRNAHSSPPALMALLRTCLAERCAQGPALNAAVRVVLTALTCIMLRECIEK